MNDSWDFWIDRGGTFTDVVARDPDGLIHIDKLLSDNPEQYPDAPLEAIRRILGVATDQPIPPGGVGVVKMGTTLATNALLERKGAPTGLLVTQGFEDLLEIGYQDRPEIFALNIRKPEMLYTRAIGISERILADGTVRRPLDDEEVRDALASLKDDGIESVAILFLHAFAFPEHEQRAGELARAMGFRHISLSHEVAREIKAVGRGDTTVADAYLTPLLRDYVARLRDELGPGVRLRFMQSSGGLTSADRFSGKNAILSGPAGGVVGYAHVSGLAGFDKVIGFDMGGTSTDVSRFDGRYDRIYESKIAGIRLKAPMMAVNTVAAGGGSILRFQNSRLTVGPDSAGAHPGPACYQNGGPAALTDANLILGRIQPRYFPACFGPCADQPLDAVAARDRLDAIAREMQRDVGDAMTREEIAAGFVRIANENMAQAIKEVSVAKGYDVRDYALACFGGAGAQHACAIAESLGIRAVLLHPYAGVLSAYGIGLADAVHTGVEPVHERVASDAFPDLDDRFAALQAQHETVLAKDGFAKTVIDHIRSLDLRYEGVDTYLNIPIDDPAAIRCAFEARHAALYGFTKSGAPIEIVNLRVETIGRTDKPSESEDAATPYDVAPSDAIDRVRVHFVTAGAIEPAPTPVYRRADLRPGARLEGPALIVEDVSTIVVDPGWSTEVNLYGHLILHHRAESRRKSLSTDRDPVLLEVFNNLFMSIATQMGETLERVSHSVNIKERLDFSCALFSDSGELIANAPHIPVHLGAMQESVRAIVDARRDTMRPGEVYLTNDPYHGGSHLPDLTVVTPVFIDGDAPAFFVANRGHHADIGGIAPGSMPPFSRHIDEEGVLLNNILLVSNNKFREDAIRERLIAGPYPARKLPERFSDLRAQVAANNAGVGLLRDLCDQYGVNVIQAYMRHVRANAAETMRATLAALPSATYDAEEIMDSGARIACRIRLDAGRADIDFAGTSDQQPGNLNAPRAVVVAAVLYVLRTLVGKTIPLNGGCLDPVTLRIPEGSMLDPAYPAAVVGGNVEVSQRVVDALFRSLGVLAASQGTMNNLTFGTSDWGYYETLGGGAGAGQGFPGASGVHVHMTNTRMTDVEVLERRYPIVARELRLRAGSGGKGRWRGGDGLVRALEFREPMAVGILSDRRVHPAAGVHGGGPGLPGRNRLLRNGDEEPLDGHARFEVRIGDVLIMDTPGGGGFGEE